MKSYTFAFNTRRAHNISLSGCNCAQLFRKLKLIVLAHLCPDSCFQYGRKRLSTGNATCTKCACALSELQLDFRWWITATLGTRRDRTAGVRGPESAPHTRETLAY